MSTSKVYSNRSNTKRAALSALGSHAILGVDYTIEQVEGGFAWQLKGASEAEAAHDAVEARIADEIAAESDEAAGAPGSDEANEHLDREAAEQEAEEEAAAAMKSAAKYLMALIGAVRAGLYNYASEPGFSDVTIADVCKLTGYADKDVRRALKAAAVTKFVYSDEQDINGQPRIFLHLTEDAGRAVADLAFGTDHEVAMKKAASVAKRLARQEAIPAARSAKKRTAGATGRAGVLDAIRAALKGAKAPGLSAVELAELVSKKTGRPLKGVLVTVRCQVVRIGGVKKTEVKTGNGERKLAHYRM